MKRPLGWCLVLMGYAFSAGAAEKPVIVYKAPPSTEDERPVAVAITVGPEGSDYALRVDFDKEPWGEACRTRCANATLFLDTDNNKTTGLKLSDPKAPESGADLSITIQGLRELKEGAVASQLKVKVKQFAEDATSIDQGTSLAEVDPTNDPERVRSVEKSVYLLVDTNIGTLPVGQKVRVVYHPPDSKPLIGIAKGIGAPGSNRVEIFKDGKLTNPKKKQR
jgi:hypothetical protein